MSIPLVLSLVFLEIQAYNKTFRMYVCFVFFVCFVRILHAYKMLLYVIYCMSELIFPSLADAISLVH